MCMYKHAHKVIIITDIIYHIMAGDTAIEQLHRRLLSCTIAM